MDRTQIVYSDFRTSSWAFLHSVIDSQSIALILSAAPENILFRRAAIGTFPNAVSIGSPVSSSRFSIDILKSSRNFTLRSSGTFCPVDGDGGILSET